MSTDLVVEMSRRTLEAVIWISAPVLAVAVMVSLVVSLIQVLTCLQEATLSTVPKLAAVGAACFFLLPWMVRRMACSRWRCFQTFNISCVRRTMSLPDVQQIVAAMTFTGVRVGGIMAFAPFTGKREYPRTGESSADAAGCCTGLSGQRDYSHQR